VKRTTKKKRPETVQTAVRLPCQMLDRLRQSDLGITEGIKRGLELVFAEESLDWRTRELIALISHLESDVKNEAGGAWHDLSGAHAIFRLAILKWLARFRPEGSPAWPEGSVEFGDRSQATIDSDDPNAIAAALEYLHFRMLDPAAQERVRQFQEKTLQGLRRAENRGDKS
jgi:hypothetical protein